MVLSRLVGRSILENQPDVALFIGFIFTLVGFMTSYLIFASGMSIAMIGFSSLLILPYIIKIMKPDSSAYKSVFSKDSPSLKFFSFLFIGMALAYTILFGVLQPATVEIAFETQLNIISARFGDELVAGNFGLPTLFYEIIYNNLLIVMVAVILSYVYGSGAIFVLNYNASIAGIVYGSWINTLIWGVPIQGAYFPSPLLYLPHTILEILAYLLAAIAGIGLSKPLTKRNTKLIERDTILLVIAAVVLIIAAGLVEVTVPYWKLPFL